MKIKDVVVYAIGLFTLWDTGQLSITEYIIKKLGL